LIIYKWRHKPIGEPYIRKTYIYNKTNNLPRNRDPQDKATCHASSLELAWGGPWQGNLYLFSHLFFLVFIYLLAFKNIQNYKIPKKKI
jgi:hypothetical protein